MISRNQFIRVLALGVCLLFAGCGVSDPKSNDKIGARDVDDYIVTLSCIEYTGKEISYTEIAEFLNDKKTDIESTIAMVSLEPVENPVVLNKAICMISVGEDRSILNRAHVYLPVVNQEGELILLMNLYRTENGLEYGVEGLGVIKEALEKYPGEDLVLVTVATHISLCVIAPDNRIYSDSSTEMFAPQEDYYDHFMTDYNVINTEWYE